MQCASQAASPLSWDTAEVILNPADALSRIANPLSPSIATQCHADDGDLSEAEVDDSDLHTETTPTSVPRARPGQ